MLFAGHCRRRVVRLGPKLQLVRLSHGDGAVHLALVRSVYPLKTIVALPGESYPMVSNPRIEYVCPLRRAIQLVKAFRDKRLGHGLLFLHRLQDCLLVIGIGGFLGFLLGSFELPKRITDAETDTHIRYVDLELRCAPPAHDVPEESVPFYGIRSSPGLHDEDARAPGHRHPDHNGLVERRKHVDLGYFAPEWYLVSGILAGIWLFDLRNDLSRISMQRLTWQDSSSP